MPESDVKRKSRYLLWAGAAVVCILVVASLLFSQSMRRYIGKVRSKIVNKEVPASSFGYYWAPLGGEREAFQTMPATQSPDGPTVEYTVPGSRNACVEVGLVRTGAKFSKPKDEYVFTVYELGKKRKSKLLEESVNVPMNSWKLFRLDQKPHGSADATRLLYVLEPKGLKAKIASLVERIRGRPYYKDFAFPVSTALHERREDEMNVILVSFDTLRADRLGCMGYPEPTSPAIDALAARGVLFTQAITASPWTTTSHFSLLSGLYPSAHVRMASLKERKFSYLNKLFQGILKDNGYYTIGVTAGMGVSSIFGFGKGFDRYMEFNSIRNAEDPTQPWDHEDGTRKIFKYAADWLEENRNYKFFMFLHNYECHDPYEGTYFLDKKKNLDFIETRRALYDGDIHYADGLFGEFMKKVESLGLLSNTIIVFVSDHGEDLYDHFTEEDRIPPKSSVMVPQISNVDHGHSEYEELVHVPLIFYIPGLKPARTVLDNQVRLIDVMPTVLDCLNIQYDGPVQGESLLKLIRTGKREKDPPALSEYTGQGPEQKAIRLNGIKYIYTPDPNERKYGITFRNIPRYGLFDLKKDPSEKRNIYSDNKKLAEQYQAILQEILNQSAEIRKSIQQTSPSANEQGARPPQDIIDGLKSLGYLK